MSGLEVVKRVRAELPGTRTLVLTVHEEDEYILPILRAGANGFLNKDTTVSELMMAIKSIHAGKPYFGPRATKALAERQHRSRHPGDAPYESLTAREREAFHLVVQGQATTDIAQILDIRVYTADTHKQEEGR